MTMINALYDLLFDQEGTEFVSRLHIDVQNHQDVAESSKEVRRALQTAIEIMAALTSCARSKEKPTEGLENAVTESIQVLSNFIHALDDVCDLAQQPSEQPAPRH
ncbi:MAG: hypothetical protein O6949_05325 [Chloroflexi bacterium]|nr:hypothetical protein [Chloroflexota bacterium]